MKRYNLMIFVALALALNFSADAAGFYLSGASVPKACTKKIDQYAAKYRWNYQRPAFELVYYAVAAPHLSGLSVKLPNRERCGNLSVVVPKRGSSPRAQKSVNFYRDFDGSLKLRLWIEGSPDYTHHPATKCELWLEVRVDSNTCEVSQPKVLKGKLIYNDMSWMLF